MIATYVLLVVFLLFVGLAVCNRWLPIQACNIMGWHLAPKQQGFDGCSANGACPRCHKQVMQDSQGNWF